MKIINSDANTALRSIVSQEVNRTHANKKTIDHIIYVYAQPLFNYKEV